MDDGYANGEGMEQGQGGYCIEIYVGADGKVRSVEVEQKGPEPMEGGEEQPMGGPAGQGGMDIGQALEMAMRIHQNNGQKPDGPPHPMSDEERENAEMAQGYGKGGIRGPAQMPMRKVFTNGG